MNKQPSHWESVSIRDVVRHDISQEGPNRAEGYFRYIDIGSIDKEQKSVTEPRVLPTKGAPSRARQLVREGDILVALTRPNLNSVALIPQELDGCIASTGFVVLRSILVEPNWLFALVRTEDFVSYMTDRVQGALYPAVRPGDILNFSFLLPPEQEQRRILYRLQEFYSRTRLARTALAEAAALSEQLRQSVFTAAYQGDLTANWRRNHHSTESADMLLDRLRIERQQRWQAAGKRGPYKEPLSVDISKLPKLPTGWTWSSLEALTDPVRVIRYGILMPGPDQPEGIPYVKVLHIRNEGIDVSSLPRTSPEIHAQFKGASLAEGDLLLSIRGTFGRVAVVPSTLAGANITQDSARIALLNDVDNLYVATILRSPQLQGFFSSIAKGMAVRGLNIGDLRLAPIPLPPLAEQREIARKVQSFLHKASSLHEEIVNLAEEVNKLDRLLLSKAFRGELSAPDPGDEPAAVLLERIRAERATRESNLRLSRARRPHR